MKPAVGSKFTPSAVPRAPDAAPARAAALSPPRAARTARAQQADHLAAPEISPLRGAALAPMQGQAAPANTLSPLRMRMATLTAAEPGPSAAPAAAGAPAAGARAAGTRPPPPPPPLPPPPAATRRPAAQPTVAEIFARPENAEKPPAEKLKLLLPRNLHAATDQMARDPAYAAILTRLVENPSGSTGHAAYQMASLVSLETNAPAIASKWRGAPDNVCPAEILATRLTGFAVHPHDYVTEREGPGAADEFAKRMGGFSADIQSAFNMAKTPEQLDHLVKQFIPPAPTPCLAVRMNSVFGAMESMNSSDRTLFNGSRPVGSGEVLQRAFELGGGDSATEASVRNGLAPLNVPKERVDQIVGHLRAAMMID